MFNSELNKDSFMDYGQKQVQALAKYPLTLSDLNQFDSLLKNQRRGSVQY